MFMFDITIILNATVSKSNMLLKIILFSTFRLNYYKTILLRLFINLIITFFQIFKI